MTNKKLKKQIRSLIGHCGDVMLLLGKSHWSRISTLTEGDSWQILENYSPNHQGSCTRKNALSLPFSCELQIIVPAYNVEKYLKQCMDSILAQRTKYRFHVVLVDDGSTDRTGEIADAYLRDSRVTVIHQENRGLSGARNRALENIFAEYLMFVDSDDMLAEGAIEALLDAAYTNQAKIVQGSFYEMYDDTRPPVYNTDSTVTCVEPALGNLDGFPWGKVFRSDLFASLVFPEGFWFEDTMLSVLIFPQVEKAYILPRTVYAYRQTNPNSITTNSVTKPKCIDTFYVTKQTLCEHAELGLPIDQAYVEKVFRQILLNGKRIRNVPERVKEAVFILSADLVKCYLPDTVRSVRYRLLLEIMRDRDYGMYRQYVKWH